MREEKREESFTRKWMRVWNSYVFPSLPCFVSVSSSSWCLLLGLYLCCLSCQILRYVECFCGPNIMAMHTEWLNHSAQMTQTSLHSPSAVFSRIEDVPLHQNLFSLPFRPTDRILCLWAPLEQTSPLTTGEQSQQQTCSDPRQSQIQPIVNNWFERNCYLQTTSYSSRCNNCHWIQEMLSCITHFWVMELCHRLLQLQVWDPSLHSSPRVVVNT